MQKKMIDYKVVYSGKITSLATEVAENLKAGYVPHGDIFQAKRSDILINSSISDLSWCQIMVQYEPEKSPASPI